MVNEPEGKQQVGTKKPEGHKIGKLEKKSRWSISGRKGGILLQTPHQIIVYKKQSVL